MDSAYPHGAAGFRQPGQTQTLARKDLLHASWNYTTDLKCYWFYLQHVLNLGTLTGNHLVYFCVEDATQLSAVLKHLFLFAANLRREHDFCRRLDGWFRWRTSWRRGLPPVAHDLDINSYFYTMNCLCVTCGEHLTSWDICPEHTCPTLW